MMTAGGWKWGPYILAHLGLPQPLAGPPDSRHAAIWNHLPLYRLPQAEPVPTHPAGCRPSTPCRNAWKMPNCALTDYAAAVAASFDRPDAGPSPAMVLAEAVPELAKPLTI